MAFRGWPAEALEFYEGLEADNSKAYWQTHKADYEKLVRGPMEELLTALAPEFGGHDVLKTAPKGYPRDHLRIDLLRNKGLVTWKQWPVGPWLGTKKARDRVVTFLRASRPLNAWLDANVGPSLETQT